MGKVTSLIVLVVNVCELFFFDLTNVGNTTATACLMAVYPGCYTHTRI